jgi:ketosteroid isomerase-like protein
VTEADLSAWMDAYAAAFNAQDSQAAANLFTEEGTYQWGSFGELLAGRDAIRRAWDEHTDPDEIAEMTYEVLAIAPDVGVARWIASHTNERAGRRHRYDGVFLVTLTEDGLCDSFREWWDSREEAL